MTVPGWARTIIWIVVVLVIVVLLKVDIHLGVSGVSITQGLVN